MTIIDTAARAAVLALGMGLALADQAHAWRAGGEHPAMASKAFDRGQDSEALDRTLDALGYGAASEPAGPVTLEAVTVTGTRARAASVSATGSGWTCGEWRAVDGAGHMVRDCQ